MQARRLLPLPVHLALFGLLWSHLHGAEIIVTNPGFETQPVAAGFVVLGAPTGWMVYNPQNINGTSDSVGLINPTGTDHFPEGAAEGNNAAVVFLDGPATGEAGLQQTLAATLQPQMRYTLSVAIGNIAAGTANFGYFNLTGFPGYRVDLLAGDEVIASDNNSLAGSIPDGEFRTTTLTAAIGAAHPQLGEPLTIRLVNLNQPGTVEAPGIEVNFDAVRLIAEPVPLLSIRRAAGQVVISWLASENPFRLETTLSLNPPAWDDSSQTPVRSGGFDEVTLAPEEPAAFFRLGPQGPFRSNLGKPR